VAAAAVAVRVLLLATMAMLVAMLKAMMILNQWRPICHSWAS
jgi:hypothetical protein